MFNLGRILTGLATLAAVLVGAALGAPALMDWEHLRAPAEARAEALLGGPVRIDGRITVQLLPSPRLSLGDVVLEAEPGRAVSGDFARARVHLAFWPLLSGKAVPRALFFSGADLLVDRAALADDATLHEFALPVSVKDGRVRFEAGSSAADITALALSTRSGLTDGTRLRLSGLFGQSPFSIRAVLRGKGDAALRSVMLDFGEGQAALSFVRADPAAGGGADIQFKLNRGDGAIAFLTRLFPAAGRVVKPDQMARLGPLALAVRAVPEGGAFALHGLEVTAGPLRLAGGGRFRPGARPGLDLELGARTLVLGGGDGFDPSGLLGVLGQVAEWGEALDGSLRLHADHILAGGAVMRRSELRLSFGPEGTRLDRFRMALPDGLSLSGQGVAAGRGQLAATVRLEGARVRDALSGLEADGPRAADGELPLTVEGELVLSGARAALNDVRITAGRNKLRAEAAMFFGERTAFDIRLEAGTLDLRPFGIAWEGLTSDLSAESLWSRAKALAARTDVTARIELGTVRLADETLRDGVLDVALDGQQLILRRLSVEEESGRSIEARLRVPLAPSPAGEAKGGPETPGWTARAEAALDVRSSGKGAVSWRAGLWDGVLSLETESPLRSRLAGRLTSKGGEFQWSDIEGRIGKAPLSGELVLVPGEKPVLRGQVHAQKAAIVMAGGTGDALWPDWPLSGYWPRGVDIHLDWSADELTIAGAPLTAAEGTAVLEADTARLILVRGALYGGTASGTASLTLDAKGLVTWESQGIVQRADLAALMGGGWQGRGMIRQSTSGSGASIAEIVSGLRGSVGLKFEEGRIGGLDAPALAAALREAGGAADVKKAVDNVLGTGATPFRRLEGDAKIGSGELDLSGISAQTDTGPVMLAGVVSFPARLIAARADISLGDSIGVPLPVQVIGRMEAPDLVVDTERLANRHGE